MTDDLLEIKNTTICEKSSIQNCVGSASCINYCFTLYNLRYSDIKTGLHKLCNSWALNFLLQLKDFYSINYKGNRFYNYIVCDYIIVTRDETYFLHKQLVILGTEWILLISMKWKHCDYHLRLHLKKWMMALQSFSNGHELTNGVTEWFKILMTNFIWKWNK